MAGWLLLRFNSGDLPVEWRRVFFSWSMLLLAVSMSELGRGRITVAFVPLVLGGFFMVRRLAEIYPEITTSGFWPLFLIAAGVLILLCMLFRPRIKRCGRKGPAEGFSSQKASGVIDVTAAFSGSEQLYLDPEFMGGRISTFFGGAKLDLRRTELPEGETVLKVESFFGGVEIYAPDGWDIEVRAESVFGGFIDSRPPMAKRSYDDGRRLIVRASNVFGGGEIK
jgi:predicted membrane protein